MTQLPFFENQENESSEDKLHFLKLKEESLNTKL